MKSDDEKLRELFEMKEKPKKEKSNFDSAIRRAKTISIIRTVVVSFMIFVIIGFVLFMANATILNRMSHEKENSLSDLYHISMPNTYMGATQTDDRVMAGEIEYVRYRFLGNKPVIDGTYKDGYSYMYLINGVYGNTGDYLLNQTSKVSEEVEEDTAFNKAGRPIMKFYHPRVKYEHYTNDLEKLNEIESSKLMEISLSFDKAYSIDEVKDMIPKDITLNWHWVDVVTDEVVLNSKFPLNEYNVFGIKALDGQGKPISDPEKEFIDAIMRGKEKVDHSGRYGRLYSTLSNENGEINKEDLKIIGVVVSGDVETLKSLKDKKFIKAASMGAVADKY